MVSEVVVLVWSARDAIAGNVEKATPEYEMRARHHTTVGKAKIHATSKSCGGIKLKSHYDLAVLTCQFLELLAQGL